MPAEGSRIAVIGSGISGMAAAYLLAQRNDVTMFEAAPRPGGHSNTVVVGEGEGEAAVDTGFIVFNEAAYPNLTALFRHLDVETYPTNMSFSASLDSGRLEYSGGSLRGLFAQKRNLARRRFWSMLYDLQRFYRHAPCAQANGSAGDMSLREYLACNGYGDAFIRDHLLPMSAAIWSATPGEMLEYPVEAFIRFQENHGLLKFAGRPLWRTVRGGSRTYVEKLTRGYRDRILLDTPVRTVRRIAGGAIVADGSGGSARFDHVVFASHADQTLAMLEDATAQERDLLGRFRYSVNEAWLHSDERLMPRRKAVWSSWNYIGGSGDGEPLTVTYWMNSLQALPSGRQYFVTLNPHLPVREDLCWRRETYEHPVFDRAALQAQKRLWSLQGQRNVWFCGAYFGSGFHEDGLQAGLAVGEQLGGVRRPWNVPDESGRIHLTPAAPVAPPQPAFA